MAESTSAPCRVVIVGGGFGGLTAARALRRAPVRLKLVDRRNHHLFQPLLYQVATAALSPGDVAYPIRSVLRRQKNAEVILAEVTRIDTERKCVVLDEGEIPYDRLILATGSEPFWFGRDDLRAAAPGLKTLEDALEIRRRVLGAYEIAESRIAISGKPDDDLRALLTFVVVGAGPTGVELAGAIAEIARWTLAREFRAIEPRHTRVLLIEGGPRILATFPEALSKKAAEQLRTLGVEVMTDARVEEVAPGRGVRVRRLLPPAEPRREPPSDDGTEWIAARTVLWAAGVTSSPLARSLGVPLDRAGRVIVEPDLTVPGHPDIYVIGDLALFTHQTGAPLPGVAPVALQQGRAAARNIVRSLRGLPPRPFHYLDKGNLATIGRSRAVADFGRFRLWGYPAWIAWSVVHIFFLIGFRNRLVVSFEWMWAWFTRQRAARLITAASPSDSTQGKPIGGDGSRSGSD